MSDITTPQFINCPTKLLHPRATLPEYGSDGAAGADFCCVGGEENLDPNVEFSAEVLAAFRVLGRDGKILVRPGESVVFRTGVAIAIHPGFMCSWEDRSGLSVRNGLHVCAGIFDEDYRGEWFVCLTNHRTEPVTIKEGQKIIQGVYHRRVVARHSLVHELPDTVRGAGAFGSTDTNDGSTALLVHTPDTSAYDEEDYLPSCGYPPGYDPLTDEGTGSLGAPDYALINEHMLPMPADPNEQCRVYTGSLWDRVVRALRDGQRDIAMSLFARDKEFFPDGVADIDPGSLVLNDDQFVTVTFQYLR